jgi:hypothetical protein
LNGHEDPLADPGASQEHTAGSHEAAEETHDMEEHHMNALAVFVGGTHAEDQTQGTLGLEYERHLARRVGLVLAFEYAGGDFREYILGAGVAVNPVGGLIFTVGAGLERRPAHEDHGEEHEVEVASNEAAGGKENLFLFRLGVTYEIELGPRWYLAPQFNLDFVDGEVVEVFGVSVGFGF